MSDKPSGMVVASEIARRCGVSRQTVNQWRVRGYIVPGHDINDSAGGLLVRYWTENEAERIVREKGARRL